MTGRAGADDIGSIDQPADIVDRLTSRSHFQRWLALWSATVDERHAGQQAELAKVQATRIAGALHRRLRGHRHAGEPQHPSRARPAAATRFAHSADRSGRV